MIYRLLKAAGKALRVPAVVISKWLGRAKRKSAVRYPTPRPAPVKPLPPVVMHPELSPVMPHPRHYGMPPAMPVQ